MHIDIQYGGVEYTLSFEHDTPPSDGVQFVAVIVNPSAAEYDYSLRKFNKERILWEDGDAEYFVPKDAQDYIDRFIRMLVFV